MIKTLERMKNEMNQNEYWEAVVEILEMEREDLSEDMLLEDIDTWDSIAILSVISIMNERFDRYPSAVDVRENKTVGELLSFLAGNNK